MAKSKRHCPLTTHGSPCIYEPGRCLKCRAEQLQAAAFNLRRIFISGLRPLPGAVVCRYYEPAGKDHQWTPPAALLLWQEQVGEIIVAEAAELRHDIDARIQQRTEGTTPRH